jgi:hypothetical protein
MKESAREREREEDSYGGVVPVGARGYNGTKGVVGR